MLESLWFAMILLNIILDKNAASKVSNSYMMFSFSKGYILYIQAADV